MHLVAVFFLYQRVPSEKIHLLQQQGMSLDAMLAGSREKLGDRPQLPHEDEEESSRNLKKGSHNKLGAGNFDTQDAEREEKAGQKSLNKPWEVQVASAPRNRVTDKAYIADFMYERAHPPFRKQELVFSELDSKVASLQACGYIADNRLLTRCRDGDTSLIAYNAQPFPRTWCGKIIAPNTVERFDKPCHEPVRLFPVSDPPVSGEGMPPVIITSNKGSTNLEDVKCNIPC
jgi:hypothetical protein